MSWQAKLECKDEPVDCAGLVGKLLICEGHLEYYGAELVRHVAEIEWVDNG